MSKPPVSSLGHAKGKHPKLGRQQEQKAIVLSHTRVLSALGKASERSPSRVQELKLSENCALVSCSCNYPVP